MKERPILFSGPMVRAILENRKTVTRRIVNPQPPADCQVWGGWILDSTSGDDVGKASWHDQAGVLVRKSHRVRCPYGQPGDRLWVRETFGFFQDGKRFPVVYRADDLDMEEEGINRWRPSIHMPRWASRLTLEVTGVRVERLQDITEEQAIAEGVERCGGYQGGHAWTNYGLKGSGFDSARESFASLWESIHGPGSWDANPWVWVIQFKRLGPASPGEAGSQG